MTGLVIAKNEPKNSNVKISKNPKIWNKLNIKSLEIIETKQKIYYWNKTKKYMIVTTLLYIEI